jgi:hypothetical protein
MSYHLGFLFLSLLFGADIAYARCPSAEITSKKKSYCISDLVTAELMNAPSGATISWNVGNEWVRLFHLD